SLALTCRASFWGSFKGGSRSCCVHEKKMPNPANRLLILASLPLVLATIAHADETAPPPAPSPTARVVVTGTRQSEDHYRIPAVDSVGPLGTTPLLDTP